MENKFILQVVFSDGTSTHYVLDKKYLVACITIEHFREFLSRVPEVHLSDELLSQVVDYHSWAISNNVEIF